LARALAGEPAQLPKDFAAIVAATAETGGAARCWSWADAAMPAAFAVMLGACAAAWSQYGRMDVDLSVVAPAPWLVIGAAGVALVQLLTFRRRSLT
jgi:hypothetical protein